MSCSVLSADVDMEARFGGAGPDPGVDAAPNMDIRIILSMENMYVRILLEARKWSAFDKPSVNIFNHMNKQNNYLYFCGRHVARSGRLCGSGHAWIA
jgi:hypothetical protein